MIKWNRRRVEQVINLYIETNMINLGLDKNRKIMDGGKKMKIREKSK